MQSEVILTFFQKFIESELGIIYSEHNFFQLQNRLEEITKLLGFSTIDQLFDSAQKGITGSFRQLLLDISTNNETSFFRDNKVFAAFEKSILPEVSQKINAKRKIRIWSAASSTGQEALTVSILIQEFLNKFKIPVSYSILATDISSRVLEKAKSATYTQLEVQRGLPAPLLVKYFTKDEKDMWTAKSELISPISYLSLNLKDPFSHSEKFDIIFCRNVLIYQSVVSKIEILKKLTSDLEPGGFLILGAGESLLGLSSDYKQAYFEGAVIYQKIEKAAEAC